MSSSLSAMQRRHQHMRFIERNLDLLLAVGWAGYQKDGRGAILVDADRAVPDPAWAGGITPGLYVTRAMLQAQNLDWPDTDIKRMVRQYDPQTEIVVAIVSAADSDYYRFGAPNKTPLQAWQAVGPQLGEMTFRPGELERWVNKR